MNCTSSVARAYGEGVLATALAGLGLGLSLIVAIGAQNLFVLRQGLRREHVLIVAVLCTLSDAALIALGVSGVGLALQALPWLVTAVRWVGAAFLTGYALLALRRAWHPSGQALRVDADASDVLPARPTTAVGHSARTAEHPTIMTAPAVGTTAVAASIAPVAPVVATCLALTWLNPHVYLDTVFLLGSVAATHGDMRWWFALGAACASLIWFFALAYGARLIGRWLSTSRAWRIADAAIGVVMLLLAASLVLRP